MTTYAKLLSATAIDRNVPRQGRDANGRMIVGQLPASVLATMDFFPLDETPAPEPPAPGMHWEARYALAEGRIAQTWAAVEDPPPPPRSLSKVRLMRALKARDLWAPVKGFIQSNETFADEWELSTTLDEDHELVKNAVGALRTQLEIPEQTIEEILAESVAE